MTTSFHNILCKFLSLLWCTIISLCTLYSQFEDLECHGRWSLNMLQNTQVSFIVETKLVALYFWFFSRFILTLKVPKRSMMDMKMSYKSLQGYVLLRIINSIVIPYKYLRNDASNVILSNGKKRKVDKHTWHLHSKCTIGLHLITSVVCKWTLTSSL